VGILEDKVAVITGAASGIGRATARLFAREGARVMLADVQDTAAVCEEIGLAGGTAWSLRTDVSDPEQVRACIAATVEHGGRLDVLVTAAGIGGGAAATADYGEADFQRVLAVNLAGVFYAMKYALQVMQRRGSGTIVTIGSVAGLVGLARSPAYAAAKGGVVQLTKVAALEYAAHNIRVNCVCPGMIDTPMVQRTPAGVRDAFLARQPLGRLGTADEVARAVLYLASDASSFTTGATLAVDGGFLAQ
jgi:NAD(P)-dependent dehydrogenase (short-subunit alcohol dehydrogenase family)